MTDLIAFQISLTYGCNGINDQAIQLYIFKGILKIQNDFLNIVCNYKHKLYRLPLPHIHTRL